MIKIDVEVGSIILMGKFKNKRTIVKTIGTDDWGMPTINGKKACNFRIAKEQNMESKIPKLKEMIINERDIVGAGSLTNVYAETDGSLILKNGNNVLRFVSKKQVSNLIRILNKEMSRMK